MQVITIFSQKGSGTARAAVPGFSESLNQWHGCFMVSYREDTDNIEIKF